MAPGLKDIAAECGVSAMAVSLALRGDRSISESRRKAIQSAAQRLGYVPNVNARSLRGGKTHSIGILWSLGGPHDSLGLIRDLSLKLMHNDYVSYVADSLSDPKLISSCLKNYVNRNIDGMIIQAQLPPEFDSLITDDNLACLAKIKNVVIVNESSLPLPDALPYDTIWRQRQPAIDQIIGYLVSCGRRNIATIAAPTGKFYEQQFIDCLKGYGIEYENCQLTYDDSNGNRIPEAVLHSIYSNGMLNYDAIMANNDETAAQVINYLQQHKIKVPEDVAVVGFNDSQFAQYFTPPIASVNRRTTELAATAVRMLLNRLKNKNIVRQKAELPMRFVNRASAGKPLE